MLNFFICCLFLLFLSTCIEKLHKLHKYIYGILSNVRQYPLAVNGLKIHIHIFFEMLPLYTLIKVIEKTQIEIKYQVKKINFSY